MTTTFPIVVNQSGQVDKNTYPEGIKQYLIQAIQNKEDSFGFDNDFGTQLHNLLFSNDEDYVKAMIEDIISNIFERIKGEALLNNIIFNRSTDGLSILVTYNILQTATIQQIDIKI